MRATEVIVRLQEVVDKGEDPEVKFYVPDLRQYLPVDVVNYDPGEADDLIELSADI